jgi:hypothetical protein
MGAAKHDLPYLWSPIRANGQSGAPTSPMLAGQDSTALQGNELFFAIIAIPCLTVFAIIANMAPSDREPDPMPSTLHSVTYIDAATGKEWGGQSSACSYESPAAAIAALHKRDLRLMFCDGYILDFSMLGHLGIFCRVEFTSSVEG